MVAFYGGQIIVIAQLIQWARFPRINFRSIDHLCDFVSDVNYVLDQLEHALIKKNDRHFEIKSDELRGCLKTCESAPNAVTESLGSFDIAVKQENRQLKLAIKQVNT